MGNNNNNNDNNPPSTPVGITSASTTAATTTAGTTTAPAGLSVEMLELLISTIRNPVPVPQTLVVPQPVKLSHFMQWKNIELNAKEIV